MPKMMMSPAKHMKEHARLAKLAASHGARIGKLEKRSIVARPKKLKMRDGAPLMHLEY
jgi:hypothetical protein